MRIDYNESRKVMVEEMKEQFIVYFISKTRQNMHRFIEEALNKEGLSDIIPSHGSILTVLYESKTPVTMKVIAEKIGKDKSTVTVLINHLLSQGYIEKKINPDDKRVSLIGLTERGRSIEQKYRNISKKVIATAYEGLSNEDRELFLSLLKRINNNFKDHIGE